MPQQIDQAFIKQYETDVHLAYQRKGSKLRGTVRTITGVTGSTARFQKAGKGKAVQKTRAGVITPMNQDQSYVDVTLGDWYAGDWIDKLDLLKTNIDERQVVVNTGAYALGRQTDTDIITQMGLTSVTVGDYSTGLTKGLIGQALEKLNAADVPDDGDRYAVLTPHAWEEFLSISQVTSRDYVGEQYPLLYGQTAYKWRETIWTQHSALVPASGNNANNYIYHKTAIGQAIGSEVQADFDWQGDRAAWFVNNMMSEGAALIDSLGVVQIRTANNSTLS